MIPLSKDGKRDEWGAFDLCDQLHSLLAKDNREAGNHDRYRWHIERRDENRRALDAAASAFCGRPVTGYGP